MHKREVTLVHVIYSKFPFASYILNTSPTISIPTPGTFFRGDLVMETISTAILPLPLIQEEQLSVTGKRMHTKYW